MTRFPRQMVALGQQLLMSPFKLLIIGIFFIFSSLLLDGTMYEIWRFSAEKIRIGKKLDQLKTENLDLRMKVNQARYSDFYIEKIAREQLDLLKEDELIFIFEH